MEQAPTSTVHIDNSLIRERLDNIMKGSHILFQNVNPFLPTVFEPRSQIKLLNICIFNSIIYKIKHFIIILHKNKIVIPQSTRGITFLMYDMISYSFLR